MSVDFHKRREVFYQDFASHRTPVRNKEGALYGFSVPKQKGIYMFDVNEERIELVA